MMNANSPTCARLNPARRLSRVPCPVRNAPTLTPTVFPSSTTAVSTTHDHPLPLDDRRIEQHPDRDEEDGGEHVAHRPHQRLDLPAAPDSATSEPARNAPSATEYPAQSATSAAVKQNPMLATSVVSGLRSRAMLRIAGGTIRSPTANDPARKASSRPPVLKTRAALSVPS